MNVTACNLRPVVLKDLRYVSRINRHPGGSTVSNGGRSKHFPDAIGVTVSVTKQKSE